MSTREELTTRCLQLLQRAGLENAEVIRTLPPQTLADRLAEAGRELGLSPGVTLEALIDKVRSAAERRGIGELNFADLQDLWWDLPGTGAMTGSRGLPGQDDFPVWGRDPGDLNPRDDESTKSGLPGEDDVRPWGSDRGDRADRGDWER